VVDGIVGRLGFRRTFRWIDEQNVGWRWILFASAAVSVIGMLMVHGTPESRAEAKRGYKFDTTGVLTCMMAMVALQVFATQGRSCWTSDPSIDLLAMGIVLGVIFLRTEFHDVNAFVDFRLFSNLTYTGATLSNLLLNAVAGLLLVAMTLVQVGGGMTAQGAGLLTLGYAISIVAFIRLGEKLLQRFGPRKPMIWGSLIVGASILLLMPTCEPLAMYEILAILAFTLFGIGLAFYATPSTDAVARKLAGGPGWVWIRHLQDGFVAGRVLRRIHLGRDLHAALSADNAPVAWIAGTIAFVGSTGQPRDP
jgi:DHA2 family multidrug resistance protein-like MFS transporter